MDFLRQNEDFEKIMQGGHRHSLHRKHGSRHGSHHSMSGAKHILTGKFVGELLIHPCLWLTGVCFKKCCFLCGYREKQMMLLSMPCTSQIYIIIWQPNAHVFTEAFRLRMHCYPRWSPGTFLPSQINRQVLVLANHLHNCSKNYAEQTKPLYDLL